MGLLVIATCVLVGVSWRLSQGPLNSRWLADRMQTALVDEGSPIHASLEAATLTWDGFHKGVDYPLDLHASGLVLTDISSRTLLTAADAKLRFSLTDLLLGRFLPRSVEVDHAVISITPEARGLLTDAAGTTPSGGNRSVDLPQQIQLVHFRDTDVTFVDRKARPIAELSNLDLDLRHVATSHFTGKLRATALVGDARMPVAGGLDFFAGVGSSVSLNVAAFQASALAKSPALAGFKVVDVPVSLVATGTLGAGFALEDMQVSALIGAGRVLVGQGAVPVVGGQIVLNGSTKKIAITEAHVTLAQAADGLPEAVDLTGSVAIAAGRLGAELTLAASHVDAADLSKLWPEGVATNARKWVTEHVLGGIASKGSAAFAVEADTDLANVAVTRATADLDLANASFTWIDHVPPIEQAAAHLHLANPDTLEIAMTAGRQRIGPRNGDLVVNGGQMRIDGLSLRDQTTQIHAQIAGPVTSALALLSEPRLKLLAVHPLGLKPNAGDASAKLDISFPLETKLDVDDIVIRAEAHLTKVQVPGVLADRDLGNGTFDLGVDKNGLSFRGDAELAAIPVKLNGMLDFNLGSADQIVQRIDVSGQPSAAQLDSAGVTVTDLLTGPVPMTAVMIERRNGQGSVSLEGDLTAAELHVRPLAWRKPAGSAANATATLVLSHDRLSRIDRLALRGDGILLTGSANFADGRAQSVLLDTVVLGRTQGHGAVHVDPNGEIGIVLQGSCIDLAAKLMEPGTGEASVKPMTVPAWDVEAHFDQALLANNETADHLLVRATGGGEQIKTVDAVGTGFSIRIAPQDGKRHLQIQAADAGRFLLGLDAIKGLSSGRLAINGTFDSAAGLSPVQGTATINDVVVKKSPVLGKLLQAITLYGLVDALRGPGMGFPRIVAPFRYDGLDLYLTDALATNPSLGLTASGRIGLSSPTALTGTIVPAYFFNAMPGRLPFIGKLFSPEKGGGLFAVRFSIDGAIADPEISVNPVSGLTPGFLRSIFGIFSGAAPREGGNK